VFVAGDLLKVNGRTGVQLTSFEGPWIACAVTYRDVPFLCLGEYQTKAYMRTIEGVREPVTYQYVLVFVKNTKGWIREDLLELA
jgi:hypothetical protein